MLPDRCLSVLTPVRLSVLSVLPVTLVYCGQTAGWIKMPLGMKVDLGPGNIMLDGNHVPPKKKAVQHLQFWPTY